MLEIAICEDNRLESDLLCELLHDQAEKLGMPCHISAFECGDDLLQALENGIALDYLIADIYMNGRNGILTAMKVRAQRPSVQIAFLTASREFALDAFQMNALHYLVKPVTVESVAELLRRYQLRTGAAEQRFVRFHTPREELEIPLSRIEKLASAEKKCDLFLTGEDAPLHLSLSFAEAEAQLPEEYFLRITRGLTVHMDYIVKMSVSECQLKDGLIVLLSRGHRGPIREKYRAYHNQKIRLSGTLASPHPTE